MNATGSVAGEPAGGRAAVISAERPRPATAWDRPGWVSGMCWLYCRRDDLPVLWIGPATSSGIQAPMYACETCLAELDEMVWRAVIAKDGS